jgi:anti-sigma factor RsiW
MKCSKCKVLYTQWKDEELSTRLRRELEGHLAKCAACRSLYSQLDRIVEASSNLPRFHAGEDVAERVVRRMRSSETALPVRLSRWFVPRLAYGAVVMVVAAAFSFALFNQFGRKPAILAEGAETRERIYSLGPAVQPAELTVDEPDYSLGLAPSSPDVVYSLPSLPVAARPASY